MISGQKINAVVIDSGCSSGWSPLDKISGISIIYGEDCTVKILPDYEDQIGHGTAVIDCLLQNTSSIDSLFCIKLYSDPDSGVDIRALIHAFEYINSNVKCDLVIVSSGIICTDCRDALMDAVDVLCQKGIIVVAAYDNNGAMSYPAAFDSVIGVATNIATGEIPHISISSKVNVVLPERSYRLRWVNPPKIIIGGSSFAAPIVAAHIADIMIHSHQSLVYSNEAILLELSKRLSLPCYSEQRTTPSWLHGKEFASTIKKAVVFPWNKESSALARFHELLPFQIQGFYDDKFSLNTGKKIQNLLGLSNSPSFPLEFVHDINALDWNSDFDTFICSHCTALSALTHRNYHDWIIQKALEHGKQIYAFDREFDCFSSNNSIFVPEISTNDVPYLCGGRLFDRSVPLIAVYGTSSKQGKFSVQLELRKRFLEIGYNIAQIVSEPSGYLFGVDAVFPFGYNSNVDLSYDQTILTVNRIIESVITDETDAVIVGNQSGTIPFSYNNSSQMNLWAQSLLYGSNPDVFIVCINPHDPIQYIQSTVEYLHSFSNAPIASLVLFPNIVEPSTKLGYGFRQRKLSDFEILDIRAKIEDVVHIPVRVLGNAADMDAVFDSIIDTLS